MANDSQLTEEELESLRLHVAGATVRHKSPFAELPVPRNEAELSQEMVDKWVVPFYMWKMDGNDDFDRLCAEATPEIAHSLLAEFNWRPRMIGARLIAVLRYFELQEEMSALFLRSDVCYVGREYTLALASLDNDAAVETLGAYLDYYLGRPDLGYDQGDAMAALIYLDERRKTNHAERFMPLWEKFIGDNSHYDLTKISQQFKASMSAIHETQHVLVVQAGAREFINLELEELGEDVRKEAQRIASAYELTSFQAYEKKELEQGKLTSSINFKSRWGSDGDDNIWLHWKLDKEQGTLLKLSLDRSVEFCLITREEGDHFEARAYAQRDLRQGMARGLYRLGIMNEEILEELSATLSAQEQIKRRHSMPRKL